MLFLVELVFFFAGALFLPLFAVDVEAAVDAVAAVPAVGAVTPVAGASAVVLVGPSGVVIGVEAGRNVGAIASEALLTRFVFATFGAALAPLLVSLFPVAFELFGAARLPVFFAIC